MKMKRDYFSRRNLISLLPLGTGLLAQGGLAAQTSSGVADASGGARIYNVRDYGAKGDGATLDTAAFQAALDACNRDRGGVVLVPAGDFIVGTIQIKSNVTLRVAAAGRVLGSGNPAHYSAGTGVPPRNGNVVLLYAVEAENITIEGPGTIDGQGEKFWTGRGDETGPVGDPSKAYFERPHLGIFYRCRNLSIRDIFLRNSAYHCLRILSCSYVKFDGIQIYNRVNFNNDGFHFTDAEYVKVGNCNVKCQDDACMLGGSCRFVTVTNCTFSTRWSVFRIGGGLTENIAVSNCVINDTYGCPIKIALGANTRMENISFSNLIMNNVTGPISVGLDSARRRPGGPQDEARAPGIVRNLAFRGIRATVLSVRGQYPEMPFETGYNPGEVRSCLTLNGAGRDVIQGITLDDIQITYGGGGTSAEARREIPEIGGEYFEIGTPPAYGLFARGVQGLNVSNVRFDLATPDQRPAVVFDRVRDAAVNGLSVQGNSEAESAVRLHDSQDVLFSACRVLTPSKLFLQVEGSKASGIVIDGGDLSKSVAPFHVGAGAAEKSVKLRA
jgi:hypothetical protein